MDREQAVVGVRIHELAARLRELRADEHRHQAADEEEEERRADVLHADHLVVGVDLEVVLPAVRAVVLVVVDDLAAARPGEPVVEAADAGQEPERHHQQRDLEHAVAVVDGLAAEDRADAGEEAGRERDPERRVERGAIPARREELGGHQRFSPGTVIGSRSRRCTSPARRAPRGSASDRSSAA